VRYATTHDELNTYVINDELFGREAILKPTSTKGLSDDLKSIAPPINTMAQKTDTHRAVVKPVVGLIGFIQSTTVAEANELIDELNVDIAAAKIPATRKPVKPGGKWVKINHGNTRFGFKGKPS